MNEKISLMNKFYIIVFLAGLILFVLNSLNYYSFNMGGEISIFEESLHTTMNGFFLQVKFTDGLWWGFHFFPFIIFLFPFYYLFESSYTLIFLQAVFLAVGAIPLFKLANLKLQSEKYAFIVSIIYLLSPLIFYLNLEEVHSLVFVIPLLLFAILFLEEGRIKWFITFIILSLMIEETVFLVVIPFSIYIMLKKNKKLGLSLFLYSTIFFIIILFLLIPAFREKGKFINNFTADENLDKQESYVFFSRFSYLGNTPEEIVKNLLSKPYLINENVGFGKIVIYVIDYFKFFLFIPLLSSSIFVIVPAMFVNAISMEGLQRCVFSHHHSTFIPILFYGFILGLLRIKKHINKKFNLIMKLFLFFSILLFINFTLRPIFLNERPNVYGCDIRGQDFSVAHLEKFSDYKKLHAFIDRIPKGSTVKSSLTFTPYFVKENGGWFHQSKDWTWSRDYIFFDKRDLEFTPSNYSTRKYIDVEELFDRIKESGYKLELQTSTAFVFKSSSRPFDNN